MSCPWAKIENPEPVNFIDILNEEVAKGLQAKKEKKFLDKVKEEYEFIDDAVVASISEDVIDEMQCDKEYSQDIKYADASKDLKSDSEYYETDIKDRKNQDIFDPLEKELASIPGYKMKDEGRWITKPDIVIIGRKNASKVFSTPPEFQTEDDKMFNLNLSNKAFNSLEMYSQDEQVKLLKLQDKKEQATVIFGIDPYTRMLLYKMIVNKLLQGLNGVINVGTAVILHGTMDPSYPHATEDWPEECAIKVFKTTLSEFKQQEGHFTDDHRFKERLQNQITRRSIKLWAEKEMSNLIRLKRAGINCPRVIKLKRHILVMSFIGKNGQGAPKLKDAVLSDAEFDIAYKQVKNAMKALFEKANLIHGDLSENNILWYEGKCYFIDVSNSVEPSDENSFYSLHIDCVNITNFFGKSIPDIDTAEELFSYIIGCDFNNEMSLDNLKKSFERKCQQILRC